MASIPTGSGRLGVQVRVPPRLSPNAFKVDHGEFARSLAVPIAANDAVENFYARQRDRRTADMAAADVRKATLNAADVAAMQSEEDAADFQIKSQMRRNELDDQASNQDLGFALAKQNKETELAQKVAAAEQAAQDLQVLNDNEEKNRTAAGFEASNRISTATLGGVQTGKDISRAEGKSEIRVGEDAGGRYEEEWITPPTGEPPYSMGKKYSKTPEEMQQARTMEQSRLEASQSLTKSRSNPWKTKAPIYNSHGEVVGSKLVTVDPATGQVINEEVISGPQDGMATGGGGLAIPGGLGTTLNTTTPPPVVAPMANTPTAGPATPSISYPPAGPPTVAPTFGEAEPVTERGVTFVPQGPAFEGYERGGYYRGLIYLGGDPASRASWRPATQPVQ